MEAVFKTSQKTFLMSYALLSVKSNCFFNALDLNFHLDDTKKIFPEQLFTEVELPMRHQIFTFFAFICCLLLNSQPQASEISYEQLTPNVRKNIRLKIEELTKKIENINSWDAYELDALLIDRG